MEFGLGQRNRAVAVLLTAQADSLPLPLPIENPGNCSICKYCDVAPCCFQLHAAVSMPTNEPVNAQWAHDLPEEMTKHVKHLNEKDLAFLKCWENIVAKEEEVANLCCALLCLFLFLFPLFGKKLNTKAILSQPPRVCLFESGHKERAI